MAVLLIDSHDLPALFGSVVNEFAVAAESAMSVEVAGPALGEAVLAGAMEAVLAGTMEGILAGTMEGVAVVTGSCAGGVVETVVVDVGGICSWVIACGLGVSGPGEE